MNKALIPTEMDNRYLKQTSPYINPITPNQTNIDGNTYELQEIIEEKCELTNSIIDVQEMVISENNLFINSDDLIYQDTRAICGSINNIYVQGLEDVSLENQELIERDSPVYDKKNQKRLASKGIEINSPIAKQTKITDAQVINLLGDKSILNEHNSNSEGLPFINCMVNDNQHNISINKDVQPYSLEKNNIDQAAQIKFENSSSNVKLKDEQNEGHPICQNLKINVDNNLYQNKKHQNSETNLVVEGFINSKNEQVINLNIFLSSCEQPNDRDNSDNCRHIQSKLFREKSNFVCKCICAPDLLEEQQLNSVIHHSNINDKINKENAYTGSITTLNTKNIATYCDFEQDDKNNEQKKLIISPNINQSTQSHVNIISKNEIFNKSHSKCNEDVYKNNGTEKLSNIFEQTVVNLKPNKDIINRPNNTILIPNSNETITNNAYFKSSDQTYHIGSSYRQAKYADISDNRSATAYDVCTFPNNILPKSPISLEHINKSFPALSEKNKEYKCYIRPIKEKVTENCALENLFSKNPSNPVNVNNECSGFKYIKKIYADQPLIDTTKNFDVEKNDTQSPKLDEKQPPHLHQNNIQNESLHSVVCGEQKNVRKIENRKNKNQEMNDLQLARQLHMELNRQEFKRSSLTK